MPSEKLRWETLEALKNSKKGKITFNPLWSLRGEDILSGCDDAFRLSGSCAAVLERVSSQPPSSPLLGPPPQEAPPLLESLPPLGSSRCISECEQAVGEEDKEEGAVQTAERLSPSSPPPSSSSPPSPSPPPSLSLLSPKAMETAGRILKIREEQREKAQALLLRRAELQRGVVAAVALAEAEHLKRVEELEELKRRKEFQSVRDMMDRETKESLGRQEKLKEEQRHRMRILNLRVREAELQRMKDEELLRQRQAAGRERLRNLNSLQEEVLQLNQLLVGSAPSATPPPGSLGDARSRGNQLCSQVSEVVRASAEGEFPSPEDMASAERCLHLMRTLVRLTQEEEERKKEEEEKKEQRRQEAELRERGELLARQEAEKKKEETARETSRRTAGLRSNAEPSTLKWFQDLQDSLAQCSRNFQDLNSSTDSQTKRLKLELQKASSIPISQISTESGSQLKEVFNKLERLLAGGQVMTSSSSSGGRRVSASQHPQGLHFIRYKMAEKFVKQGEEQVASHHASCFPMAAVFSGIWELHPEVGELLLAHLHLRCPYSLPHYPPRKKGSTTEEYYRVLGYRVDEGGVEGQDSFLKRMSGMIRLYAAILTLRWPYGAQQGAAPHGLNHAWRWLSQMLNLEPLADVSATLLLDFLEVCGNALMKQYQVQFWKLLLLLKEEYLPRVEAVTSNGQMGSVTRLKHFLESSLQTQQIRPPKGQLSSSFWRS